MANTTKKYVSLDKLSLYDEKIKAKIKADDEAAIAAANKYTDESFALADGNAAALANTAESNANSYTDGKIAEVNTAIAGVNTIAEQGVSDAAAAKSAADAAQSDVDTLESYVGKFTASEGVDTVVKYIDKKTSGIASSGEMSALGERVTAVEGDVATIKANYLDGEDKTELEGKINAKADQTSLDAVSAVANAAVKQSDYDVKVAALEAEDARIVGLVEAEADRAGGVEADFETRISAMETFWDATEDSDNIVNKLKEIQDYIASDETGAATMAGNIQANAKAIEDMDTAYKAADATLQGNIDALTGVVNGKVAQGDFDTLSGKVTAAEGKISANETAIAGLQGEDTAIKGRLDTLEAAIGESGSVADDIATAKQAAIDAAAGDATTKANAAQAAAEATAKGYTDDEIDKVEGTIATLQGVVDGKAAAADLTALTGRVTTAEGEIDTLQSEMDAVEAKAAANESAIGTLNTTVAGKAAQSDLTAVGDRVTAIETWHSNFVECSEEDINGLFTTSAN